MCQIWMAIETPPIQVHGSRSLISPPIPSLEKYRKFTKVNAIKFVFKVVRTTAPPARPRARFARRSRPLEVGVVTAATAVPPIAAAAVAASSGRATSFPLLAKCCQKAEIACSACISDKTTVLRRDTNETHLRCMRWAFGCRPRTARTRRSRPAPCGLQTKTRRAVVSISARGAKKGVAITPQHSLQCMKDVLRIDRRSFVLPAAIVSGANHTNHILTGELRHHPDRGVRHRRCRRRRSRCDPMMCRSPRPRQVAKTMRAPSRPCARLHRTHRK